MLFNDRFVTDATLVCWNVAGGVRRQALQAERVIALSPDIVYLQEVIASSVQPWTEHLTGGGLRDVRVAGVGAAAGRDRPPDAKKLVRLYRGGQLCYVAPPSLAKASGAAISRASLIASGGRRSWRSSCGFGDLDAHCTGIDRRDRRSNASS